MSVENGFNLIDVEGGVTADDLLFAVNRLIDMNVDAILIFLHEPNAASVSLREAQNAGIPVAVHGIRPFGGVPAPYIGFNEYTTCKLLGEKTARYFIERFPDKKAKVLVTNARRITSEIEREKRFVDGFREVIPDASFYQSTPDDGTVINTIDVVLEAFLRFPEVNIIYNTSDLRALGTIAALRNAARKDFSDMIVVGVGGSEEAMRELMAPGNPWDAEVGLAIREVAEKSYEILMKMVRDELPMKSNKEYLVESEIFINPFITQVQDYLALNHGIEDFRP